MEMAELPQIGEHHIGDGVGWESLSEEVTESVLARVPLSSLVRATAVNKGWYAAINGPAFPRLSAQFSPAHPWLFIYCTNFLLPGKNRAYAFDPDSFMWYTLPTVLPASHSQASVAGGIGGLIHATMGGGQSHLCYNHSLFVKKWKQTSEMAYPRDAPLVGFLGDSGVGDEVSHKLIAVGGVEMFEDDDLAVEIYDPILNQWEVTESLPPDFRGNSSRHWLSGAVWKGNVYVHEIFSGAIAAFDIKLKTWSDVQTLTPVKPSGVKYAYLIVVSGKLFLAGVCHPGAEDQAYFKLWLVDETRMQCKEIGLMPADLFSMFKTGDSDTDVLGVKCVASDSLMYVYSSSALADYPMVVCDLSNGQSSWRKMPAMPTVGNRYDAMVGFCSCLTLSSVLRSATQA